jgi:ribonucleoside-diphosphate reductase alpha chain
MDVYGLAAADSVANRIAPLSRQIWNAKYRFRDARGAPIDNTIEESWRRVARALATAEVEPTRWEAPFYATLENFRFVPAGRILAGAGSDRRVTLFNCFVMGSIEDDLGAIFSHLREAALTMRQGGGIGYDFSTLRPRGAPTAGVGANASGPLSFMDVWDSMCRTIMSVGARRGAMMATLRCDHPDIEAFVDAKREPGRLRMFNLSVLVTDGFLAAVDADQEWPLTFDGEVLKTVRAAELWDRIMRATYDVAEPGVIFIDRINHRNNLAYCETITCSNPCGEIPLPPYGACLLGSINLAALIRAPFTAEAGIFANDLRELVRPAVRMLDNVIEISRFAIGAQREEALAKRRMGLGVTGLADALIMARLRYGSPDAAQAAANWLSTIEREAYLASADLAAEKGPFPLFERDKYLASEHIRALDDEVKTAIAEKGMRNSHLLGIAPTGTISLLADNVSSGIEPAFSFRYIRDVLQADGSTRTEEVIDFAYRRWRELKSDEPLPDYFVDAQTLSPEDHLVMLAAAARHVDQSISKTINLPEDIAFDAFEGVYRRAYTLGCKSCTTYRPNDVTGSVLEAKSAEPELAAGVVPSLALLMCPQTLEEASRRPIWADIRHPICPECGQPGLMHQTGCLSCTRCGWSECGI